MTYDRSDRIRRAAILVASLDQPLAEQLLADLPPSVASRVLDAAEQLDEIDAEEQQDILAEFRRMRRASSGADAGVEFEMSARDATPAASPEHAASDQPGLSASDAAAMAELLSHEHPQIIAAALSRLNEDHSAAVFAALPSELQAEALERLAALAPIDEDAALEVEAQLHERLQQRRAHEARSAAGAELVRKILARTPVAKRTVLLARMGAKERGVLATATEMSPNQAERRPARPSRSAAEPLAQQALNLASAVRRIHGQSPAVAPAPALDDLSAELESLGSAALVAALRMCDEQTVLRALAASGDVFLARVTRMLPRKQGKQLRRLLRDLGPTRLADLHQAQRALLEAAYESESLEPAAAA